MTVTVTVSLRAKVKSKLHVLLKMTTDPVGPQAICFGVVRGVLEYSNFQFRYRNNMSLYSDLYGKHGFIVIQSIFLRKNLIKLENSQFSENLDSGLS